MDLDTFLRTVRVDPPAGQRDAAVPPGTSVEALLAALLGPGAAVAAARIPAPAPAPAVAAAAAASESGKAPPPLRTVPLPAPAVQGGSPPKQAPPPPPTAKPPVPPPTAAKPVMRTQSGPPEADKTLITTTNSFTAVRGTSSASINPTIRRNVAAPSLSAEGPSASERRMSMSLTGRPVSTMPAVPAPKSGVVPSLSAAGHASSPAGHGHDLQNLTLLSEAPPPLDPPRGQW